jgi:PKD repeat protein
MRVRAPFYCLLLGLLASASPFLVSTPTAAGTTPGPIAAFTYNPCVECAVLGDMVFFNGNWSLSPNGPIVSYTWSFGDGTTAVTNSSAINHDYTFPGSGMWQVTLLVRDLAGQTDTITQSVMFEVRPLFTVQPQNPSAGQTIVFDASSTQVFLPPSSLQGFQWSFGDGISGSGKIVAHSYSANGAYRVLLSVATSQGNAQISKTVVVGPSSGPPPALNIIVRSVFGIAFYNSSAAITIQPASLFLNMTVKGSNSTGMIFAIISGQVTIGPSPILTAQRIFDVTSGQAFLSNQGRLTIKAQAAETGLPPVPSNLYTLYLTGPSRLVSASNGLTLFTRLFGFLYNSQTKIGLFFVVGISPGDIDEDGKVDVSDLSIVGSYFGTENAQVAMTMPCESASGYPNNFYADLNGGGRIDINDLVIVGSSFGQTY